MEDEDDFPPPPPDALGLPPKKSHRSLEEIEVFKDFDLIEDNKFTRDILVFPQTLSCLEFVKIASSAKSVGLNEPKRKGVGLGKENILGEKNVRGRLATYQLKQTSCMIPIGS